MSYPNNIVQCIQQLFPDSVPEKDWSVSLHGDGKITIDKWNDSIGTQPTEDELNAVSAEAQKTAKFRWIRKKRTNLLKDTDWMSGSDVTMSDAWKKYRQDLRDLPASNADPDKIVFPTEPS
tara:strand:- start:37 stop:399 length:363 start_codon:yes stop_codon:yes gene_type:complete